MDKVLRHPDIFLFFPFKEQLCNPACPKDVRREFSVFKLDLSVVSEPLVIPFDVVNGSEKLCESLRDGWTDLTVSSFTVYTNFGNETGPQNKLGKDLTSDEWKEYVRRLKDRPYLDPNSIGVALENNCSLSYQPDDGQRRGPIIKFIFSHQPHEEHLRKLASAVCKHFTVIPFPMVTASQVAEAQSGNFQLAERVVANLASETAKISQEVTKSFEKFVEGVKNRTLELEQQFQAKSSALDDKYRQDRETLTAEHASKIAEVEQREKALAEEQKKFELRNNTVVRRALLQELKQKIENQKTFEVSPETSRKRKIIHGICGLTLAVSLIVIGVFVWKLYQEAVFEWRLLIPVATWTVIFVTLPFTTSNGMTSGSETTLRPTDSTSRSRNLNPQPHG